MECHAASRLVQEVDNDEFAVDAVPFQPRFLLQAHIFTHRPYQPRLRLSLNFLCRVDWLSVRGTAQPERTILPILEVLTY